MLANDDGSFAPFPALRHVRSCPNSRHAWCDAKCLPGADVPGDGRRPTQYRCAPVVDAFRHIATFPATFDGSLPSEAFGRDDDRIVIGETYFFEDDKGGGTLGTVTTAIAIEDTREVALTISTPDGKSMIYRRPMSEAARAEYKEHPDTYFGKIQPVGGRINSLFDAFEWLMETYSKSSREFLLKELNKRPEPGGFERYTTEELAALYCERMAGAMWARMNQNKVGAALRSSDRG
jgi:hypothetical protein